VWITVSCRRIEPPVAGLIDRIVRSTLHQAEQALAARIVDRLPADVDRRLRALVAAEVPDDDAGHCVCIADVWKIAYATATALRLR
jgi:hypothetical protein